MLCCVVVLCYAMAVCYSLCYVTLCYVTLCCFFRMFSQWHGLISVKGFTGFLASGHLIKIPHLVLALAQTLDQNVLSLAGLSVDKERW